KPAGNVILPIHTIASTIHLFLEFSGAIFMAIELAKLFHSHPPIPESWSVFLTGKAHVTFLAVFL
ncbi:MAG TPA: hypothetical protein VFQ30_10835, partial [Ktedonobacteraceae bacterium]|nr:hypothetical protein [Ktedonobacteraceae bacterium]